MIVGAAPVGVYWTLDLPAVRSLTLLSQPPLSREGVTQSAAGLWAAGAEIRVFDPHEKVVAERSETLPAASEPVVDRVLAGWLYGADLVAAQGGRSATFTLWRPLRRRAAPGSSP